MTAQHLIELFNGNIVLIMFIWGVAHKYAPQLAKWDNELIPWVNAAGYILGKLAAPAVAAAADTVFVAHGADAVRHAAPDILGVLLGAVTNSATAALIYNVFGRTLLERVLGLKKAVVTG